MTQELTVHEKYSKNWPAISVVSIVLAVLFFVAYQATANVLLEGYLRLASFAFLALSILSFFKIRDGRVVIVMRADDKGVLDVEYRVRNRVIHHEEWSTSEIGKVKVDEMPDKSLYNNLMKHDRCVRFKRKKETDWIYFNKVNGRVIPFSAENANKICRFLDDLIKSN